VAINAGMYREDHRTNVGYLRHGARHNNPRWNAKYMSALAFGPRRAGLPAAVLADLDAPDAKARLDGYESVVQNLRLLKGSGVNVWSQQPKRWSEAAVGLDKEGRVLFLFSRAPFSGWEFAEQVRRLPLGVRRAMHVEGGPEASLSIRSPKLTLDLSGSYETGFNENDDVGNQWPIPNVIGVSVPPNSH
jgi:hypothetical protein